MKQDILTIENVKQLINLFYSKIRADKLLGPIFNERIQNRWPEHLEKIYRFWQTVLLGEHTYFGTPFPPHAQLPVGHEHFLKWIYSIQLLMNYLQAKKQQQPNGGPLKWLKCLK